ncbi:MAG TPA: flagellum-specific ATP synthase FliI, partial [Burkholderiales bacterium]|nr:flagellum-specific ATP synthase FliI [Burkholderiales bacterium]
IDIETSISRAMHSLVSPEHFETVRRFKQLYSRYARNRDLINVGAYVPGSDALLDQAIALHPRMEAFLQQDMNARVDIAAGTEMLHQVLAATEWAR